MIGQTLHNRYTIPTQLGKGAMGVVYRARRIAFDLCNALIRVHHLTLIHRNLKPEHILIAGTPEVQPYA